MSRRRLLLPLLAALLLAAGAILFETWLERHLPENRVEVLLADPASQAQSRMDAALLEDWIAQNLTPAFCERLEDYFLALVGCAETDLSMPDYLAARSNLQHLAAA